MELTILHLCPRLMNLYGEYANLAVLRRQLEALGVSVTLRESDGAAEDFDGAGFLYMGAGTERRQKLALERLRPCRDALEAALDRGAAALFTGSAMETLGASVTDAAGKVWPGLGLAEFATVETDRRSPGDAVAHTALWEAPVVGFMNKCSVTRGVDTPLFDRLSLGLGNEAEGGAEGWRAGDCYATHLTGPVLVKNPDFLEWILRRIFARQGWECPAQLPPLPRQREAYDVTRRELEARAGK